MKLAVHVRSRHGAVQAFCPDLPGCSASAPTEKEALQLLKDRVDEYFTERAQAAVPGTRIVHLEV
jgi:hypothetical protein